MSHPRSLECSSRECSCTFRLSHLFTMNLGCIDQSALGPTRDFSYALRRRYTGAVKRPQRTRGESLGIWTSPWWVGLPFCSISMLGTACHHLCSLGTWDIRWGSVHSTLVTFSPFPITHYLPQIHPIPYIHRPIPITLKRWQEMWCGEGLILGSVIVCCPRGALNALTCLLIRRMWVIFDTDHRE